MSESAQIQSFQVEQLLHSYGAALAARREQDAPVRRAGFDGRSVLIGFLAFFVFAPGCAAATVFLMKADERLVTHPPASKANRLPLSEWRAKAAVRIADAALPAQASDDTSFLGPIAIRGRLDEEIFASVVTDAAAPIEAATTSPRPKRKHEVRRAKPVSVVAEAVLATPTPPPTPPSLLEKLFAFRSL